MDNTNKKYVHLNIDKLTIINKSKKWRSNDLNISHRNFDGFEKQRLMLYFIVLSKPLEVVNVPNANIELRRLWPGSFRERLQDVPTTSSRRLSAYRGIIATSGAVEGSRSLSFRCAQQIVLDMRQL